MEQNIKWGKWNLSSQVQSEIDSFCLALSKETKTRPTGEDEEAWERLFNHVNLNKLLEKPQEVCAATEIVDISARDDLAEPMEVSLDVENDGIEDIPKENGKLNDRMIKNHVDLLLNSLESSCTSSNVLDILKGIDNNALKLVVEKVWCELTTEARKLCLCKILAEYPATRLVLCQNILLPWLLEGKCKCVESIAEILPQCADVACKELILPLLRTEESPLVTDIFVLKDLTAGFAPDHWCIIISAAIKWAIQQTIFSNGMQKIFSQRKKLRQDILPRVLLLD